MLFQNFVPSRIVRPGRSLLLMGGTYQSTNQPGLTLDTKLSAAYRKRDGKLLFGNFRTVNTFLPLEELYRESSEAEILEILAHDRLYSVDAHGLAGESTQWSRKRFAMLRDSGVLDDYTAQEILSRSSGHDVEIELHGDRIVVPREKKAAKKLLQFLNEELYRGPITSNLYETNSKKRAGR